MMLLFRLCYTYINFQDEYYGGVGEWREFPPVCISQLNKAVREKKTSVQVFTNIDFFINIHPSLCQAFKNFCF